MKRNPDTGSAAGRAWSALQLGLEQHEAACQDDARFTQDTLTAADKTDMGNICGTCPLFTLCHTYRTTARPKAGHWAIGRKHDGALAHP